jgi:predicted enzyme related to lactoylglutathione lyase
MQILVNIDVDNLARAAAFYQQAFGLKIGRTFGGAGVELLGANSPIYLLAKEPGSHAAKNLAQTRDYQRHWTPVHLDMVVEDVAVAVARAVAAGALLEEEITVHSWGAIAHLSDPFGHGFCLLQFRGRGYDEICD